MRLLTCRGNRPSTALHRPMATRSHLPTPWMAGGSPRCHHQTPIKSRPYRERGVAIEGSHGLHIARVRTLCGDWESVFTSLWSSTHGSTQNSPTLSMARGSTRQGRESLSQLSSSPLSPAFCPCTARVILVSYTSGRPIGSYLEPTLLHGTPVCMRTSAESASEQRSETNISLGEEMRMTVRSTFDSHLATPLPLYTTSP